MSLYNYRLIKAFDSAVFDDVDTQIRVKAFNEDFLRALMERVSQNAYKCSLICRYQNLSPGFIRDFQTKLDWESISICQDLSENLIREFKDKVVWDWISEKQNLSESFIEEFEELVNWDCVSKHQKLSEEFIEKHSDKINWDYVSQYQKLSEKFIEKHSDEVLWSEISVHQKLSTDFVISNFDNIYYCWLVLYNQQSEINYNLLLDIKPAETVQYISSLFEGKKISEETLLKYIDSEHIDWPIISCNKNLSDSFIEKYIDKLDLELLFTN